MKKLLLMIGFIIGLATHADAQDISCGWDTDRSGSVDSYCPGPDQDHDGFTTDGTGLGYDGNDLDSKDRPGIYVTNGCSGGQVRFHNSGGLYGACINPSAITAPCGASVYWADPAGSTDATCGTFANPCSSLSCFGYCTSGCPSCLKTINPGDITIIKGTGTFTATFDPDGAGSLLERSITFKDKAGTNACPIVFMRLPGSTAKIDPTSAVGPFYAETVSYMQFRNLELTGGYGSALQIAGGSNLYVEDNYVHDEDGDENNNVACYHLHSLSNSKIRYNYAKDCYDANDPLTGVGSEIQNQRLYNLWRDTANDFGFNFGTWTEYGSELTRKRGPCVEQKHANSTSSIDVHDNVMTRCTGHAYTFAGPNVHAYDNYAFNVGDGIFFSDIGGENYQQNEVVEENTFENAGVCVNFTPYANWAATGTLTYKNNVCVVNSTVFNDGSRMARICEYCDDATYADVVGGNKLFFGPGNCYYNPNIDASTDSGAFGLFAGNSGGSSPAGTSYNFNNWKATAGYDTINSAVVNPGLIAGSRIAGNPLCLGYLKTNGVVSSGSPSSVVRAKHLGSRGKEKQ